MDQIRELADDRLPVGCIYCHGEEQTREHVPSRVFLDRPYPTNLAVVPACFACNNGFSLDEQYVACLLDMMRVSGTPPNLDLRANVESILKRSTLLREKAELFFSPGKDRSVDEDANARLRRVLTKLALGHVHYELALTPRSEPSKFHLSLIDFYDMEMREDFDDFEYSPVIGEVGSRASLRYSVLQLALENAQGKQLTTGFLVNDWIEVQEGIYRYHVSDRPDRIRVRIVLGEFMVAEVHWQR